MQHDRGEIVSLTGLRGLAATAVAASHFTPLPAELFVDMFFALSGFVISLVYLPRDGRRVDWRDYSIARFARIYPLYIVTSFAAGFLHSRGWSFTGPMDRFPTEQTFHEVMLTTVFVVRAGIVPWNGPAWSVAAEWWTYFTLFPVLVLYGSKLSKEVAAVIVACCILALSVGLSQAPIEDPTRDVFALGRAFCGFAGGWVAYRFVAEGTITPPAWLANVLVAGFVVIAIVAPVTSGHGVYFFLLMLPIIVWALVKTDSYASRLLASPPLAYLGKISYSIYLVHFPFYLISTGLERRLGVDFSWEHRLLPGLAATLIVAPLTYRFLERPARDFLRSRLGRARTGAKA